MKRILLLIIVAMIATNAAQSQVLIALVFGDKLNSPNLEFGLHAGVNLSTLTNTDNAKYTSNLNLGFYFDIRLTDNLWLHPEVLVKTTSGARNLNTYEVGEPPLDALIQDAKLERKLSYFQVPILLKYKWKYGLAVEAGIQPALRSKAIDEFTDKVLEKDDLIFENDIGDEVARLDFGLAGGISWRPRRTKGVTIVARYTYGLVDILKDNPGDPVRNINIAVGALIPIGVKKAEANRAAKATEEAEGKDEE